MLWPSSVFFFIYHTIHTICYEEQQSVKVKCEPLISVWKKYFNKSLEKMPFPFWNHSSLKTKKQKNQWIHSYDYKLPYNIQRPLYPIAVYTGHITNFKQRASLPAYTFRYPLILSTQANTWIYALQTEEEQHSRLILKEASKQKYLTFTFSVWRFSEYKTCEKH